jgi:recombinational DNA repair protein (RecF pathway)
MPRLDLKHCRACGRHVDEVGVLSHSRLCAEDAARLSREAALDLANHSGPYFKRWRAGMAASVGAVLLDDSRESA